MLSWNSWQGEMSSCRDKSKSEKMNGELPVLLNQMSPEESEETDEMQTEVCCNWMGGYFLVFPCSIFFQVRSNGRFGERMQSPSACGSQRAER